MFILLPMATDHRDFKCFQWKVNMSTCYIRFGLRVHPVWITYKGSSFTWVSKMVVAGVELWRSQYMGKLSVPRKHGSSSQVVTLQGWSHGHVTLTVLSQVIAYHTFQVSTY